MLKYVSDANRIDKNLDFVENLDRKSDNESDKDFGNNDIIY